MSDLKGHAVRGAGASIFARFSSYGISMAGTIVLARILTPDDFGLIAMVAAFSLLLQNFGVNGFTEAVIQSTDLDHRKLSTLFWINSGVNGLLALSFVALSPVLAWFYKEPRLQGIASVMALTIFFAGLSTQHRALLARNMQFYKVTAIELAATSGSIVLAIALSLIGSGYWSLVGRRVMLPAVGLVMAWLLCGWRPGLPSMRAGVAPLVRFALNTYGNFTVSYFARNLDKILLGWKHGAQSLGSYNNAYNLFVMPVNQLSYPLTNVAIATLSRLREDEERYRRYYLNAVSVLSLIGMAASVVLTVSGRDIVLFLLGSKWEEAGQILTVFAPGVGLMIVYATNNWLHLSLGRAERMLRWGIFSFVFTALALLAGLPFGAMGVAAAYTLSFHVLVIPGLWYAGKPIQIGVLSVLGVIWRYYLAAAASAAAVYGIFSAAGWPLGQGRFAGLTGSMVLSGVLYLLLVVLLHGSFEPITRCLRLMGEFKNRRSGKNAEE
jgi:PST family polysaccharide transporter